MAIADNAPATHTNFNEAFEDRKYINSVQTSSFTAIYGSFNRVNATSGAVTVTLPTGADLGRVVVVKKTDGSGNAVTMTGTINGGSGYSLTLQNDSVVLVNTGTGTWEIETILNAGSIADGSVVTSKFAVGATLRWSMVSRTSSYTAGYGEFILCDASGGAFNITLPLAASHTGELITVKKTDNTRNVVTVVGTIDARTNFLIRSEADCFEFISDGTNWFISNYFQSLGGTSNDVVSSARIQLGSSPGITVNRGLFTSVSQSGNIFTGVIPTGLFGATPQYVITGSTAATDMYPVQYLTGVSATAIKWLMIQRVSGGSTVGSSSDFVDIIAKGRA